MQIYKTKSTNTENKSRSTDTYQAQDLKMIVDNIKGQDIRTILFCT